MKIARFLVVALVISTGLGALAKHSYAQPQEILYLEISTGSANSPVDLEFLRVLREALNQENIEVIPVVNYDGTENYEFWKKNALHIIFTDSLPNQRQMIFITPYVTMKLPPSPLLEAYMQPVAVTILKDTETFDQVLTISVGMAMYATKNPKAKDQLSFAVFDDFIHPDATNSLIFYYANCAILENDLPTAERLLKSIIPTNKSKKVEYAEAIFNLAWIYLQTDREQEALHLISDLVDIASTQEDLPYLKDVRILSKSAQFNVALGQYDDAIVNFDLAIEIAQNPINSYPVITVAELFILRGQMYLNLYEWDKSLNDFNIAIELAPDYAVAYFQRGVLYYSVLQTGQELREEALADFRHYLELAPEGEHADQAREYAAKIEAELAALNE